MPNAKGPIHTLIGSAAIVLLSYCAMVVLAQEPADSSTPAFGAVKKLKGFGSIKDGVTLDGNDPATGTYKIGDSLVQFENGVEQGWQFMELSDAFLLFFAQDGAKNGPAYTYDKEGNLESIEIYKDDKWRLYRGYHQNGQLAAIGCFRNDRRDGLWVFYDETGTVTVRGEMLEGVLDGWCEIREDDEGPLVMKYFKEGEVIEEESWPLPPDLDEVKKIVSANE